MKTHILMHISLYRLDSVGLLCVAIAAKQLECVFTVTCRSLHSCFQLSYLSTRSWKTGPTKQCKITCWYVYMNLALYIIYVSPVHYARTVCTWLDKHALGCQKGNAWLNGWFMIHTLNRAEHCKPSKMQGELWNKEYTINWWHKIIIALKTW